MEGENGWAEVSWDEAARTVDELANGLLALGIRKGDAVGILAQTSLEWSLFDFALGLIGAVGAAIYANSSPRDCLYVLEHSDAVAVLVENEEQRAKIAGAEIRHVITFDDLDGLRARGRAFAEEQPNALAEAEAAVGEEDLFTFIYTSGTTGPPKGCMIRHRNYYEMAGCVDHVEAFAFSDDTMLLYLPLAHNFGRLMHLLGAHVGYTIAFCPDPLRIAESLPVVRPTLLPSVPRLYEKVHTALQAQFDVTHGVKRRLLDFALRTGRQVSELREQGRPLPAGLALRHRLADRLVYRKVKNTARRTAAPRRLRRRAAREGDRRALPRARHPDHRGLGPDRVHDSRVGEPAEPVPLRDRRPGATRLRGARGRGRRAPDPQRDRLRGLLQGRGGHPGGARRRRLAPHR